MGMFFVFFDVNPPRSEDLVRVVIKIVAVCGRNYYYEYPEGLQRDGIVIFNFGFRDEVLSFVRDGVFGNSNLGANISG